MAISFVQQAANLLILLTLLRLIQVWLVSTFGDDHPLTKAIAFVH